MKDDYIIIISKEEQIAQALESLKNKFKEEFDIKKVTVAEMQRLTSLTRGVLRELKKKDFKVTQHGNTGKRRENTILKPYETEFNNWLSEGITNSDICFRRLIEKGYKGSLSSVKNYISSHKYLVPTPRKIAIVPQRNRGRRYETEQGEMFQMDWGFVKVEDITGSDHKYACFVMVCHHCGYRYVEFFTSAKQENLFIGMIHAFNVMGVPQKVLTDNMASVSNKRDGYGHPIFNPNYDTFQKLLDFETKMCKPYHPFTKGAAERLVQYVKQNFVIGCHFDNLTDLNNQVFRWCKYKNSILQKGKQIVPSEVHANEEGLRDLPKEDLLFEYLAPVRDIAWDGYISQDNRRYGVPFTYTKKQVRVMRQNDMLYIFDPITREIIQTHEIDWSKHEHRCDSQWEEPEQPEEHETAPIKVTMKQNIEKNYLCKFEFDMEEF